MGLCRPRGIPRRSFLRKEMEAVRISTSLAAGRNEAFLQLGLFPILLLVYSAPIRWYLFSTNSWDTGNKLQDPWRTGPRKTRKELFAIEKSDTIKK